MCSFNVLEAIPVVPTSLVVLSKPTADVICTLDTEVTLSCAPKRDVVGDEETLTEFVSLSVAKFCVVVLKGVSVFFVTVCFVVVFCGVTLELGVIPLKPVSVVEADFVVVFGCLVVFVFVSIVLVAGEIFVVVDESVSTVVVFSFATCFVVAIVVDGEVFVAVVLVGDLLVVVEMVISSVGDNVVLTVAISTAVVCVAGVESNVVAFDTTLVGGSVELNNLFFLNFFFLFFFIPFRLVLSEDVRLVMAMLSLMPFPISWRLIRCVFSSGSRSSSVSFVGGIVTTGGAG